MDSFLKSCQDTSVDDKGLSQSLARLTPFLYKFFYNNFINKEK